MSFLLDTNAVIALITGKPPAVRQRFRKVVDEGTPVVTSTIVLYELWYGVAKSVRRHENTQRLHDFLSGMVSVLPFEDDDARKAGEIRASLEKSGAQIGPYDLLIAGHALRSGATLVTANTSEFRRVSGLVWQDWTRPGQKGGS